MLFMMFLIWQTAFLFSSEKDEDAITIDFACLRTFLLEIPFRNSSHPFGHKEGVSSRQG
jgi:hypothetical protein